jgi:hypothetical protein
MKKKHHIVFLIVISICSLFVVVTGITLIKRFNALQSTKAKLNSAENRLKQLFAANPFPSTQNVERVKVNVEELSRQYDELIDRMRKGQIDEEPERKSPTAFMQMLGRKRQELQEKADSADNVVPPNFPFGFERYFAPGAASPAPDDVPKLSQQLGIIEKLCKEVFIKRGVKIEKVEREEIEQSLPGRYRKPVSQESPLFRKLQFVFVIKVKEALLKQILKELSRLDMFVVVNSLTIEKLSPDVREIETPKPATETDVPAPPPEGAPKVYPPRAQRVVCGPELEAPMKVELGLTVYIFGGKT